MKPLTLKATVSMFPKESTDGLGNTTSVIWKAMLTDGTEFPLVAFTKTNKQAVIDACQLEIGDEFKVMGFWKNNSYRKCKEFVAQYFIANEPVIPDSVTPDNLTPVSVDRYANWVEAPSGSKCRSCRIAADYVYSDTNWALCKRHLDLEVGRTFSELA